MASAISSSCPSSWASPGGAQVARDAGLAFRRPGEPGAHRAARLPALGLPGRCRRLKSANSTPSPGARIQSATAGPVARGQGFRSAGGGAGLGELLAQRHLPVATAW